MLLIPKREKPSNEVQLYCTISSLPKLLQRRLLKRINDDSLLYVLKTLVLFQAKLVMKLRVHHHELIVMVFSNTSELRPVLYLFFTADLPMMPNTMLRIILPSLLQ